MDYACSRPETEWSIQFRAIMDTDPSRVTDKHLKDLFRHIRAELWPVEEMIFPAVDNDPMLTVVRFCRGVPAIIFIMGDLGLHMKDELGWAEIAQIIKEV